MTAYEKRYEFTETILSSKYSAAILIGIMCGIVVTAISIAAIIGFSW